MDGLARTGLKIRFDELTRAEANVAAEELRRLILEKADSDDVKASVEKDDPDSQDAGSTLVLLFGSGAAVAVAQGIRAWFARRSDDSDRITILSADGTQVVATGEAARNLDAPALIRATKS